MLLVGSASQFESLSVAIRQALFSCINLNVNIPYRAPTLPPLIDDLQAVAEPQSQAP